jgi:formyltetrahydrofolate deformylase
MSEAAADKRYILTLSCKDVRGIVAAVTGFLAENNGFIIESAQYGDASTGRFFLRIEFTLEEQGVKSSIDALKKRFHEQVGERFSMQWQIADKYRKSRVLVMVSKFGHCLNDLLYRYSTQQLAIEIPAIVSNHRDWEKAASWHNIPFYHCPMEAGQKDAQETKVWEIIQRHEIDVVVLARYMQVLSEDMCRKLSGRAINIHHSFLPSFKGAKPYMQAYERGVKLIGATAHYVTTDLDEGPIIEQEVARVDHTHSPEDLTAIGRDIECLVLARALKFHTEHRVLLNGHKTVVFK